MVTVAPPSSIAFAQKRATPSTTTTSSGPAAAPATPSATASARDLIERGRTLFDDQKYEESIQVLSAALVRPGNSKADRIDINRLLAFNYITLNRRDEAESAIRGLLALEPGYDLPASESPRFRDVFTSVRAKWEAEGRPGLVVDAVPVTPVTLIHASRSETDAGQLVPIAIRVDDPGHRVRAVKVFYRTGSKGEFTALDAELHGTSARAVLPASAVHAPFVDYYLVASDETDAAVATKGDPGAPMRIVVPEGGKGWVVPVVIGSSVLAIGAAFGIMALAGVFKSSSSTPPNSASRDASVSVTIRE